ncbi:FtsB family cell division protein [Dyadobacter diqingensis]|jgi:cell division protein FtsB|uniref:FtsB family cell division protein n=1 Tax=Dyadobacter diqingensis TaxID=2938121 RepID=UPI0020C2BBF8|nr:septum formation initiator family protein [Dyadobacter diqingensis]
MKPELMAPVFCFLSMTDLKNKSYWLLQSMRQFYTATFVVWLVWILFLDNNNLKVVLSHRVKMKELEKQKSILEDKIKKVVRERNEVFGNPKMLEKWAREEYYMRKPHEDVYVIVDENNQPIESRKEE